MKRLVVPLLAALLVAGLAAAPAEALTPGQKVDLRVLVVSPDGNLSADSLTSSWTAALDREGVPYDVYDASGPDLTAGDLEVAADHGRYQGVICVTQCDADLSVGELAVLTAYEVAFEIRQVNGFTYLYPSHGLNAPFLNGAVLDGTVGSLTAAGDVVFPYLAGPVQIEDLDATVDEAYGYLATPADVSTFSVLVEGPPDGGTPSSLVGVYQNPAGFEEMVLTFNSNQYQLHQALLAPGMVNWVTGGAFLGYWRNYFVPHFDDIFLPDDRWDPVANCTPNDDLGCVEPGGYTPIRMVASDVDRAKTWSANSAIRLEFVFNGGGNEDYVNDNGSDPFADKVLGEKASFGWINHTYTHMQLDGATEAQIVTEIQDNLDFATAKGIPIDATELVTGEHSGLHNAAMPAALTTTGVKWVAADNSIEPDPYPIGPAITVPRYPSNVYYNTATQDGQLDEYNYIYLPPSLGGTCVNTSTTTCLTAPATWAQYVDSEVNIMLPHLLTNDPRPHYFHQSNLAEDGVFYLVVDELLSRYDTYYTVPLVQPTFAGSGTIMQRAAAWGTSMGNLDGYRQADKLYLHNTGGSSLQVPVSGHPSGALYGGQRSLWVTVGAGATAVVDLSPPPPPPPPPPPVILPYPTTVPDAGFLDVAPDSVHKFDIDFIAYYGITKGTSPTTFDPFGTVTRWQMALFLTREWSALGGALPTGVDQGFADIGGLPLEYQVAINQLAQLGITQGTSSTTFDPLDPVTRWQMALFIIRLYAETGLALPSGSNQGFLDIGGLALEYQVAINQLAQLGITTGTTTTTYSPDLDVLRQEMASFLARTLRTVLTAQAAAA